MRRTVLAVLLLAVTLLWPTAAAAGGPTSLLVTSPESGRATAFYYSDAEYAALDRALHDPGLTTGRPHGGSTFYNLTWLVHDVSVWRTDQVAVSRAGVWVTTTDTMDDGAAGAGWREVSDVATVRSVLDELARTGSGDPALSQGAAGAPEAVPDEPAPRATAPEVRTETRWFSLAGWRWAVPGALVGALLVATASARRRGPAEPRQQLVEREPERVRVPG